MSGFNPASGFRIQPDPGFNTLKNAWEKAPEMVTEELTASIYEAELLLQREVVERTPKGIGQGGGLAGSIIAVQPQVSATGVLGIVGTPLNYAPAVELGSKPHKMPIQPLIDWVMHAKGISDEKTAKSIAWAIWSVKSRSSTLGRFMFRDGFQENATQVNEIFARCNERIIQRLAGIAGA